jgi:hypothetical protein
VNADVELKGLGDLEAALKSIDDQLNTVIMDGLEEVGNEMAETMNSIDRLNVAHDTFTADRRKTTVGVGPSRAGGRAHIVRFHEFGTVHQGATPTIRVVADSNETVSKVKAKMARRLKQAIAIAGKGAKRS